MSTGRISTWYLILGCAVLTLAPVLISAQEEPPFGPEPGPDPNPTRRLIRPRHDQTEEQQLSDERECYDLACEETEWDPYEAYAALVAEGYVVALTPDEMTEGLVCLAAEGAVTGEVAGDLVGRPRKGAEIGAAIAVARAVVRAEFLTHEDDPAARRVVGAFERNLRHWERKYAACLRPRGYEVSSP